MTALLILLLLLVIFIVVWMIEPRAYLFWFQSLMFKVDRESSFISDIHHYFPESKKIEENADLILSEFLDFSKHLAAIPRAHEIDEYNKEISRTSGPGWRTFYLKVYNGWFNQNCDYFPQTTRLFRDILNVTCVMFSVMEPGNDIPPHQGKMKGLLRYQLPLIVPEENKCSITVNHQLHYYKKGIPILFDDNVLHSAKNEAQSHRVVLFLDIRKKSPSLLRLLDDFCMKLIQWSPKFTKANVGLHPN